MTPPAAVLAWRPPAPFRPPLWARHPHVQTVGGKYLRPAGEPPPTREVWDTPDGDELVVDLAAEPRTSLVAGSPAPLVVVLHGLEGHARRPYALLLHAELARRGMRAVGMNFRGCARPNRTARAYHSGETGDLRFVLDTLARRFPERARAAVGFSLGGNVLLKHLGDAGSDDPGVVAAAAISVPYDLAAGARVLETSAAGRRYAGYFLDSLRAKVREKANLLEGIIDVPRALESPTIRAFDDRVTAPLHGFRDAGEYYALSSSAGVLDRIRVPTALLHARDDPFLPWERVPTEVVDANPWLRPAFTDRGGHVGFMAGAPWAPTFWAEATAADFLAVAIPSTATVQTH